MTRVRILMADDHRLVAEGLRSLLEPAYELVEIVEDGRELVGAAQRLQPDVIVADVTMPLLNGLDAVEQLRRLGCQAKVVFLTMHKDPLYAARALRAGASGFVLKHSASAELLTAIQRSPGGTDLRHARDRRTAGSPSESGPGQRRPPHAPAARSPTAVRRRSFRQGSGQVAPHLRADRGGAQSADHGTARGAFDRRPRAVRDSPRADCAVLSAVLAVRRIAIRPRYSASGQPRRRSTNT